MAYPVLAVTAVHPITVGPAAPAAMLHALLDVGDELGALLGRELAGGLEERILDRLRLGVHGGDLVGAQLVEGGAVERRRL